MTNELLATMSNVSHRYGDVIALDGLDLDIRSGEVLAVLGPNGAGKTTAISLLLGSLRTQEGSVKVFDQEPGASSVRMRRGAMLQVSGVADTITVSEHLHHFASYYPNPLPISRLLAMADLEEIRDRRFSRLSGGQKQRLMFALALVGDPELVFLDEPTTGLDVEIRRSLWNEIRELKSAGRTAVLTTHYLEEADALADRIVVINQGQVVAQGTPNEIKSRAANRRVRCTTSLDLETIANLPDVVDATMDGQQVEIFTAHPENLLRRLFELDPDLSELEVTSAGLEEAFLTLVRGSETSES